MKVFGILLFLIYSLNNTHSSSIFVPDSDTALLVELVTTTIEQLNELENLISKTDKLTGKIQKYNEIAIDHWYRAQRVTYLVEEIAGLKDSKIKNLGDLNSMIRHIKSEIAEFKEIMNEYGILQKESEQLAKQTQKDDLDIKKEFELAKLHLKRAHSVKTPGNIHKVNMQINANSFKTMTQLHSKNNKIVKLLSDQNSHIAKEKLKKSIEDMERKCFYFPLKCPAEMRKNSKRRK